MKFDVLLFDLIGVLVDDSDEITEQVLAATQMTEDQLWSFWVDSSAARDFDRGFITSQEFGERMVRDLNLPISPDQFLIMFREWVVGLYDGAAALLESVPNTYLKACLSNINEVYWPAIGDEYGLSGMFEKYYLSHEMGMLKPDIEVFEFVVRDLGVAAERIAFFDDLDVNVAAARQLGIEAYRTKGIGELKAQLGRLGIVPN